jgi:ribonucleoside-diphosphate reductase alpha chain
MMEIPKETLNFFHGNELHARIFYEKYSLTDLNDNRLEKTPLEMWKRVAKAIAGVEKDKKKRTEFEKKFYWLMEDFKFVPGGRILFAAGSQRKATLLNCYYIPIKDDSLDAIFGTAKEMAITYARGGGTGIDISVLRPRGSIVHNSARFSTGSVSFMELFSLTTGSIGQSGRRGALMITIDVRHPDVEEFVTVKSDKKSVRFANISVKVSDDFMHAVENGREFELSFKNSVVSVSKKVKAKELWKKMVETSLETGDPGIIFWDHVKRESPTEYDQRMAVKGVNPCSEQPLEDFGACDLGSLNLGHFVEKQFTKEASVMWDDLEKAVRYSVRFLDNVLDYSFDRHALKAQAEETVNARRIGLGIMGLANMFIELGIKYDSDAAVRFSSKLFERIKETAYDESCNIATEKGSFKYFNPTEHLKRDFVKRLSKDVRNKIGKTGLRNSCLITIAPTGSISTMIGISGGIEPLYALSYTRRSESLSAEKFEVLEPIVETYMNKFGIKDKGDLPAVFVTAHKIDWMFRVKLQAEVQKHVDSSISSTVNLQRDATADDVSRIFLHAWKSGCKSITVYREGSKEDILTATEESLADLSESASRPLVLTGTTVKLPTSQGNLYVTVNKDPSGRVKEVFIDMGRSGEVEKSYTEALGRIISIYLQSGGDVEKIMATLRGIKGGNSMWFNGVQILSIPDAVSKAIELVLKGKTNLSRSTLFEHMKQDTDEHTNHQICPSCGQHTLISENGCYTCKSCGYTKCE